MLHFKDESLPRPAIDYLNEMATCRANTTVKLYRAALHHFYRFLLQENMTISDLTPNFFSRYDEDLERHGLKFVTRRSHRNNIHIFLRWLETRGDIMEGTCKKLFPDYKSEFIQGKQAPLPDLALKFIEVIATTSQPSTVNGYKATLRSFYKVHWKRRKKAYTINRTDIEAFMIFLKNDRKMAANHRFMRLVLFRRYLEWLYDHDKLKKSPDKLIKASDFPKREEKLPRPFPPDVDIEIQRRLWEKNDIDHLGLLLMRRCGLRAGELRDLTLDCVEQDLNDNWFLKVPLGKLHNERIFPLDPKTVEVIEKIKLHHSNRPEAGSDTKYLISNKFGRRRSRGHFNPILQDLTKDLSIPGKVTVHRLRHSFATSLLSAGMSITSLKKLLGHKDIRMTLNYASITQETIRKEYFTALSKVHERYEMASYPLKVPDLKHGVSRAFYDTQASIKKFVREHGVQDKQKLNRLLYRLNSIRHEFSLLLQIEDQD